MLLETKDAKNVKYDNKLNDIQLGALTESELNAFMTLCACSLERGNTDLSLTYNDYKALMGCKKNLSEKELIDSVERLWNKIRVFQSIKTDKSFIGFSLFNYVIAGDGFIKFQINDIWYELLNKLNERFTAFELKEFVSIKGKHAKILYRLLKQYRTSGVRNDLSVEDVRNLFGLSDSFPQMNIKTKILSPAAKELSGIFKGLTITTIRGKRSEGATVIGYKFTWVAEKIQNREEKDEEQDKKIKNVQINKEHQSSKKWSFYSTRTYDFDELEKIATNNY